MGWTFTHRAKGQSHLDWFKQEWPESGKNIVAMASKGKVVYGAYKVPETGHVAALVILIQWVPSDPRFNFGYKDMDESMGPNEADCPEKILKLLSPVDDLYKPGTHSHEWASNWRERCWSKIKSRQARGKLEAGKYLYWPEAVRFTDGQSYNVLRIDQVKPLRLLSTWLGRDKAGELAVESSRYGYYKVSRYLLDSAKVIGEAEALAVLIEQKRLRDETRQSVIEAAAEIVDSAFARED